MHEYCREFSVQCDMPQSNQLVAVSIGVFDGDQVQGVRYYMEKQMSGWIVTTDRYNGDVNSLSMEHFSHLSEKRPDLVKYLCLPVGWRFDTSRRDVWFDETIQEELQPK